ncbi:cytochrome c oxidase assembly protein COX11, mitochondrial [Armadillidium vulgare]|nr:cytochrome c oxidase assembly protein COX11, mitochondrial [Armadillidium vulgare]
MKSHFLKNVMVSIAVSKLGKTSIHFVEPEVKINREYYQNNLLAKMIPEMKTLAADYLEMNTYLLGLQNAKIIHKYSQNFLKNQYYLSSITLGWRRNISFKVSPIFSSSSNLIKDSSLEPVYTYLLPKKNVKLVEPYSKRIKFFSTSKSKCGLENDGRGRSYSGTKSTLYYIIAIGVLTVGLSYAAVPLYRIFCQVKPGETALAFYSARNPTNKPVIGISTYNVLPFEAGQYFNKIQCFCFEEQMLNPNEEVSMPVFFYIDPEFADDPFMEKVQDIVLSYTFFEVKEGHKLIDICHNAKTKELLKNTSRGAKNWHEGY